MKLAAEPRSSSRAPACVLAGVWSLTRKLLLISHLLALFLAKPSTVLTCFAATEDDAEVAGKAGGKACPNKSPGLVRRKLEGTDGAPVWLDVALQPAGAMRAAPSYSCWPHEVSEFRWAFWTGLTFFGCLNKDVCFLCCSLRKKSLGQTKTPLQA